MSTRIAQDLCVKLAMDIKSRMRETALMGFQAGCTGPECIAIMFGAIDGVRKQMDQVLKELSAPDVAEAMKKAEQK